MGEDREARLQQIADEIRDLTESPLYEYRVENHYSPVIGEGSPQAAIMFVGEAPGRQEARQGRPFVGAAGRLLDELLSSIDLGREQVYITNLLKDRPPDNRDPTVKEIELYGPYLLQQIQIIQPQVIATLGRFAMRFILEQYGLEEKGGKISELHGETFQAETSYGEVSIVPLYHPAVVLYRPEFKGTLVADFETLKSFM